MNDDYIFIWLYINLQVKIDGSSKTKFLLSDHFFTGTHGGKEMEGMDHEVKPSKATVRLNSGARLRYYKS